MPGGQYANLREQARAMGLEHVWSEVSRAYSDVNRLFGDVTKVTPTSKVVGDMALSMATSGLSAADVLDPRARGGLSRIRGRVCSKGGVSAFLRRLSGGGVTQDSQVRTPR
jgi:hypothetical protein